MIPLKCSLWQNEEITIGDLQSSFEIVEVIVESSHLDRSILRCKECGQLYYYEMYEHVDFLEGNDKMYSTYIPILDTDQANLNQQNSLKLLSNTPRINWDPDDRIYWVK